MCNSDRLNVKNYLLLVFFLPSLISGCGNNVKKVEKVSTTPAIAEKHTVLLAPLNGAMYTIGDEVQLNLEQTDSTGIDSVEVFFEGKRSIFPKGELGSVLETGGLNPGRKSLRVTVYFGEGKKESHGLQLNMLSDITPRHYTYRVIKSFPHDRGAYTQGLEYRDGWLYEGTGQKGESSLRRVSLEDGRVVQIRNLSGKFFGEGITLFGERIYQLTYMSQVGFVYDRKTFEEIQKVYYQNKEGWGLTNNAKELIMSDGTNVLYFVEPESFTIIRQVEVYDNTGPVDSLNELEYINGKIYANRYYTDEIEIIDPESGKILGKANLKGLLPVSERKPNTNVLNGIAWDKEGKRLLLTGKYWPKLYQVELMEIQ